MYKKKIGVFLLICCLLAVSSMPVFAAELTKESSIPFQKKQEGNIYDDCGNLISIDANRAKAGCSHIPCAHVTDTVWQHVHVGVRCDVYRANATWCNCCKTILDINSDWIYSYSHYGCTK